MTTTHTPDVLDELLVSRRIEARVNCGHVVNIALVTYEGTSKHVSLEITPARDTGPFADTRLNGGVGIEFFDATMVAPLGQAIALLAERAAEIGLIASE